MRHRAVFFTGTSVGSFLKKLGVNHLKVGKRFSTIFHELGMILEVQLDDLLIQNTDFPWLY